MFVAGAIGFVLDNTIPGTFSCKISFVFSLNVYTLVILVLIMFTDKFIIIYSCNETENSITVMVMSIHI